MNKQEIKKRLTNPVFLGAAAGFIYNVLGYFGIKPDIGMWKLGVDLVAWLLIGAGVYSTFGVK